MRVEALDQYAWKSTSTKSRTTLTKAARHEDHFDGDRDIWLVNPEEQIDQVDMHLKEDS